MNATKLNEKPVTTEMAQQAMAAFINYNPKTDNNFVASFAGNFQIMQKQLCADDGWGMAFSLQSLSIDMLRFFAENANKDNAPEYLLKNGADFLQKLAAFFGEVVASEKMIAQLDSELLQWEPPFYIEAMHKKYTNALAVEKFKESIEAEV